MNSHIFREYDIRGLAGADLTPAGVEKLGRAFGTYYAARDLRRLVVARDVRLTSPAYAAALTDGLVWTGRDVIDIGMVPTPVMNFAVDRLQADGGIVVTASHNPPEFNGFKSRTREGALFGVALLEIRDLLQSGRFTAGDGNRETQNLLPAYADWIAGDVHLARPLHVVVDCGNGTAGIIAPKLLARLGCQVESMYSEPDGRFPHHLADPTVPAHMGDLIEAVRRHGADVGIGFDGDADRVGLVDETGRLLFGDELLIVFARHLLPQNPGAVVFDVKCSQALVDEVERLGGTPEMWRTGYPHITSRMRQTGAVLAGEMSGHLFLADRSAGYDDGIYAACRALEILASDTRPLSAHLRDLPHYVSTAEIRIDSTDEDKFRIVEAIGAFFRPDHETLEVDGVRILFENGWALVRASNTQPLLVLRFEARDSETLASIRDRVQGKLAELGVHGPN